MVYLNSFGNHLREQGKVEKTIQSYTGDLAGFLSFLSDKGIQFDGLLNQFTIQSYKNYLLQENYEPTTFMEQ